MRRALGALLLGAVLLMACTPGTQRPSANEYLFEVVSYNWYVRKVEFFCDGARLFVFNGVVQNVPSRRTIKTARQCGLLRFVAYSIGRRVLYVSDAFLADSNTTISVILESSLNLSNWHVR